MSAPHKTSRDVVEVRRGAYHDSVSLMQVSRAAAAADGVAAAMVAMGTALNLDLIAGMGFDLTGADARPDDLVIALRAAEDRAEAALAEVEAELAALSRSRPGSAGLGAPPPPRTAGAAAARVGGAGLALVSVPGEHAFVEAMDALRAGLHVMVFSDNVPVGHELALKDEAARRGLLVMGPDCGTAIVGGMGLGFANVVRPGPVGLVAASGTGLQQLCCLLDDAGAGISHALGVGGRDLSAEVGGSSTLAAVAALDADPATELVVVLSKPPDPATAARVRAAAADCATPVVLGFVGRGERDLTAVAVEALRALGLQAPAPRSWPAHGQRAEGAHGAVRGLYSGGTLCDEAMVIAAEALGPVRSNIPLDPGWALGADLTGGGGHLMIDFGDDRLTRGRPHPMIDHTLRLERIAAEAADPSAGVLLLDVVLGHAAHPDPAAELAPALAAAVATARRDGRDLAVVVSLCASAGDPQDRERQAEAFVAAGASVHLSNAEAARTAVALTGRGGAP